MFSFSIVLALMLCRTHLEGDRIALLDTYLPDEWPLVTSQREDFSGLHRQFGKKLWHQQKKLDLEIRYCEKTSEFCITSDQNAGV